MDRQMRALRSRRLGLSRRQALLGAAALAGGAMLPRMGLAQASAHAFRHGDFEITVLSDGHLVLPSTIHGIGVPPEEVRSLLAEAGLDAAEVKPATNPALIAVGSERILLDTGSGAHFQPTAGRLPGNLALAGIDPGSITKVVFTHAHPDHIWGTVGDDGALRFPNAAYFVAAAEWDFWMDRDLETKLPPEMAALIAGARTHLAAVEQRMTLVRPGDDIIAGISVLGSAGHTPGHISLLLAGDDGLLIPADAVTEPFVYFPHPEWRFAYDMDSELAVTTRKGLLDRAATDRMKMLGFHWPYPGVGFAERKGTGYRYVPAS